MTTASSSFRFPSRQFRSYSLYEQQHVFTVLPLKRVYILIATFLVMALWILLSGFLLNHPRAEHQDVIISSLRTVVTVEKTVTNRTKMVKTTTNELGTIVFLAPQRRQGTIWEIDRFCLLLRAVRSVNQHLNLHFGPYPIHIVIAKDYSLDPENKDGLYTEQDRALIRAWAPDSTIHFVEVDMYSQEALEPDMDLQLAETWKASQAQNFPHGIGYASMCRLWSGRLQQMDFLRRFQYYMRMDDVNLLQRTVPFDPFVQMKEKKLTYAYRRMAMDHWGIQELWRCAKPFIDLTESTPFITRDENQQLTYRGLQPYNNFHVSSVEFWRSPKWKEFSQRMDDRHLFFKHRVGDANVHAIAIMMMPQNQVQMWGQFPCAHNSNDMPSEWGVSIKMWRAECDAAYAKNGVTHERNL